MASAAFQIVLGKCEGTVEDKTIYTRPWKISTVFCRRREKNAQLNEFKCVGFVEELIYGDLRKKK